MTNNNVFHFHYFPSVAVFIVWSNILTLLLCTTCSSTAYSLLSSTTNSRSYKKSKIIISYSSRNNNNNNNNGDVDNDKSTKTVINNYNNNNNNFYYWENDCNNIIVSTVSTYNDIIELADIRYNEWIQDKYPNTDRNTFRMATLDIYNNERKVYGAIAFLAKIKTDNNNNNNEQIITTTAAVGAAELSPIELQGAIINNNISKNSNNHDYLYVTDVVSSREYRRKGIAHALMYAIEQYVKQNYDNTSTKYLLLHVATTNTAAMSFYTNKKIGYTNIIPNNIKRNINLKKLATNAGTEGQTLLLKQLSYTTNTTKKSNNHNNNKKRDKGGKGFA